MMVKPALCLILLGVVMALPTSTVDSAPANQLDVNVESNQLQTTEANTQPNLEQQPAQGQEISSSTVNQIQTTSQVEATAPACKGKKCKPEVSPACKGKSDMCRNETECCEIDKCNIWQHVGRDSAVLLVFYVSWCPVSRDFMLNYDLLRSQYEPFDNLLVAKVDADPNLNLVQDFGIDEYPALVFFRRDCYWSVGGCYDPFVWRRYNGTSNDYDEVNRWVQLQLDEEISGNAYRQLPDQPETLTGCKVSKTARPPEDMRDPPSVSMQPVLLQEEEGVRKHRGGCPVKLPVDLE
eukprot:c10170_g1_i1.p1 GENE.c10170_g1_i1~~c10170_g1_i1.p1  ORF type:complete len:294 (-),score=70.46 c10170_g1_i1:11-892(-)